jgi:hypothetical protein
MPAKHSHAPTPSLAEGVAAVDREAGGMLALDVVLSSEFLELFAIAATGGGRAGLFGAADSLTHAAIEMKCRATRCRA